ncbi:crossover junction endodeoxyribonuclease RuvC [bacterium]|nr:crossover junction endodeoxyribonuclease RuvC [bacterium]
MRVLGLDPGSRNCGYCVLDVEESRLNILEAGTWNLIKGNPKRALGSRLELLAESASLLLQRFNPRLVGLEKAVAFKNISSALTLSEARGVLRLKVYEELSHATDRLIELSPTEIKRVATGSGASNKEAVEKMLTMRFRQLSADQELEGLGADAFDALAIAWTAWIVHNKRNGIKVWTEVRR